MATKKAKVSREDRARDRAQKLAAALEAAARLDGDRVLPLLGRPHDDPELVRLLAELGHTKPPVCESIELRKLGICFAFDAEVDGKPALSQVRFELRRRWTGCAKYPGRLPYGISPDLKTADAERVLASRGRGERMNDTWYAYHFDDHQIAMGFGTRFVETVFVKRPDAE